ncbi:HD domain-containing protein [uncultured Methanoregula sp.]|uniref:HD domain-containing protein n=1 Tax=uncultured Methanoregula sp. TaxID=1005933 RepID=UPI002AAC45D9|nr:HD domain-containing protein [uncultured Methanoregula sp.]
MDPLDEKCWEIYEHVKSILGQDGSHGMDHVCRVTHLCRIIGIREHADMGILIPAALLHDIARPLEKAQGIPHETEGAKIAGDYLVSIHYDETCIRGITHAIRTHRYRSTDTPRTLEARILSDADKLDAMGAAGIARTFMRAGEHGGSMDDAVSHFHDKLSKLNDKMFTGSAREIAEERHAFLIRFFSTLEEERKGSRI